MAIALSHRARPGVRSVDDPLYTLTTKRSLALVEPIIRQIEAGTLDPRRVVLINGIPHVSDIRFRMLKNDELARAMGFTNDEAAYEFVGTVEEVTKQIGNAVAVNTAASLVGAMLVVDRGPRGGPGAHEDGAAG
jgi:hypothetical protein